VVGLKVFIKDQHLFLLFSFVSTVHIKPLSLSVAIISSSLDHGTQGISVT